MINSLAVNPEVAVVVSEPVSHETFQIKGTSRVVRLGAAEEKEIVRQKIESLAAVLEQLGMPRRVTSRINLWPAFAIEVAVRDVFDQTPGPKAGRQIR